MPVVSSPARRVVPLLAVPRSVPEAAATTTACRSVSKLLSCLCSSLPPGVCAAAHGDCADLP
jgi:hypothetical protein